MIDIPKQYLDIVGNTYHSPEEFDESIPKEYVVIYSLSDPRTGEIRYAGRDKYPPRSYEWKCNIDYNGRHWENWLCKLNEEGINPTMHVANVVHQSQAADAEKLYIKMGFDAGFPMTNHCIGTPYGNGIPSDKTRQKISEAKSGVPLSESHKQALSEAHSGEERSEKWKESMSQSLKGREFSHTTIRRMSQARKDWWERNPQARQDISERFSGPKSEEHKKKLSESCSKSGVLYWKRVHASQAFRSLFGGDNSPRRELRCIMQGGG